MVSQICDGTLDVLNPGVRGGLGDAHRVHGSLDRLELVVEDLDLGAVREISNDSLGGRRARGGAANLSLELGEAVLDVLLEVIQGLLSHGDDMLLHSAIRAYLALGDNLDMLGGLLHLGLPGLELRLERRKASLEALELVRQLVASFLDLPNVPGMLLPGIGGLPLEVVNRRVLLVVVVLDLNIDVLDLTLHLADLRVYLGELQLQLVDQIRNLRIGVVAKHVEVSATCGLARKRRCDRQLLVEVARHTIGLHGIGRSALGGLAINGSTAPERPWGLSMRMADTPAVLPSLPLPNRPVLTEAPGDAMAVECLKAEVGVVATSATMRKCYLRLKLILGMNTRDELATVNIPGMLYTNI